MTIRKLERVIASIPASDGAGVKLRRAFGFGETSEFDPFLLFEKLLATQPKNVDAAHAFYLGFELAKAATALTLSKTYTQDEALNWGYLTQPERSHRLKSGRAGAEPGAAAR